MDEKIELQDKEFLEKFYKLADEYNCQVQYHPKHGMTVITKNIRY